MRVRTPILGAVAVSLLVAGLLVWRPWEARHVEPADRGSARGERESTHLEGRPPVTPPELAAARRPPGSSGEESHPRPQPAVTPTHVLEGRVTGLDPAVLQLPTVAVRAVRGDHGSSEARSELAAADGSFRIDVSSLFADQRGSALVVALRIAVDHDAYLLAGETIPVEPERPGTSLPRVFRVEIRLQRAGVVRGRLLIAGPLPLPSAPIAIFGFEDGRLNGRPIERAATAPDGRWRLRIGQPGRFVVAASLDGSLPVAREVTLAPGADVDVGVLELRPGPVQLSGTVRFRGAPAPNASVRLNSRSEGTRLHLGPDVLWTARGVVTAEADAHADAAGRYSFTGIGEGPVRVHVSDVTFHAHMAVGDTTERTVEAPATGVDFDVDGIDFTVHVLAEGRPVPGAQVQVVVEGSVDGETDENGEFLLVMPHGVECTIYVVAKDFERVQQHIRLPEAGRTERREILLESRHPRPRVVVRLVPSEGAEIQVASAVLGPVTQGEAVDWSSMGASLLEVSSNRFHLESEPGRFELRVRPGGPWIGGAAYWMEARAVVDVPSVGEVDVTLPTRMGGRLRIVARGADRLPLAAQCTIRKPDGSAVAVTFVARSEASMSFGPRSLRAETTTVDPPLEGGTYGLSFSADGYVPKTIDVRVEAGRTSDVEVQLDPSR